MASTLVNITSGPAAQSLYAGNGKYYSILVPAGGASISFYKDAQGENPIGTAVAGTVLNFSSYTAPFYSSTTTSGATCYVSTLNYANLTAFTTVTNTTTETVTGQITIPPNVLFNGAVLRLFYQVVCTGVTSTPTLQHKLYLGAAGTTADTALITATTTAVLANGIGTGYFDISVQSVPGAAANLVGTGFYSLAGAAPTTMSSSTLPVTAFATNGTLYLTLTLKWSAASSSNIAAGSVFAVEMI
jgi:hypothetical protein